VAAGRNGVRRGGPGVIARSENERWTPCPAGKGSPQRAQSGANRAVPLFPLWHSPHRRGQNRRRPMPSGNRWAAGLLHRSGVHWVWSTLGEGPTSKLAIQGYCILRKSDLFACSGPPAGEGEPQRHTRWLCTSAAYCPIHDVKDRTGGKRFSTDVNIIRTYVSYVKRQWASHHRGPPARKHFAAALPFDITCKST
jgi:hypothetical protein